MNATWGPNRRRDPNRPEPAEYCMLCGLKVGASEIFESDVQGLRGTKVCSRHADIATNPSFIDMGATGQAPGPQPNPYPHSGVAYPGSTD